MLNGIFPDNLGSKCGAVDHAGSGGWDYTFLNRDRSELFARACSGSIDGPGWDYSDFRHRYFRSNRSSDHSSYDQSASRDAGKFVGNTDGGWRFTEYREAQCVRVFNYLT